MLACTVELDGEETDARLRRRSQSSRTRASVICGATLLRSDENRHTQIYIGNGCRSCDVAEGLT